MKKLNLPGSWILAALLLTGCGGTAGGPPPPAQVQVVGVVREDVPIYGEWVGTVDGLVNATIRPQVTGYLLRQLYEEGKPVRKGTPLFEIDPRTFEAALNQAEGRLGQAQAQRVQANSQLAVAQAGVLEAESLVGQAKAGVATANGQLMQAQANRSQAQAQRSKAVLDYNRLAPLVEQMAVPRQQLDDALTARDVADAQVEGAQAQIAVARGQLLSAQGEVTSANSKLVSARAAVGTAEAALAQAEAQIRTAQAEVDAQRLNLSFCRIESPIDGVPGLARAQVGDLVSPTGDPLTTVSTVDPIKVNFTIPETETFPDKKSQAYELIASSGEVYGHKGKFFGEDRTVAANTGATRVAVVFPNPARSLRPGQYARVRAVRRTDRGALLIPQRAVTELQDRATVAVVSSEDKVDVRTVKLGPRVGSRWVVLDGLKEGERVIVEGLQKAAPGAVVKPVTGE